MSSSPGCEGTASPDVPADVSEAVSDVLDDAVSDVLSAGVFGDETPHAANAAASMIRQSSRGNPFFICKASFQLYRGYPRLFSFFIKL